MRSHSYIALILKRAMFCALLWTLSSSFLWASNDPQQRYYKALHFLQVNRSLLTKTEAEYLKLTEEERVNPSQELSSEIIKLRYKIKALKDDATRLQADLPKAPAAKEFLNDLVTRREQGSRTTPVVDPEMEKRIDDKLDRVYKLHEKALLYISEGHLTEAAAVYEEIILISPDDDEAYLLLGHTYLMSSQYSKSASAFRNAVHIRSENAAEIAPFYENILIQNPEDDEAYCHLGYAWMFLGDATKSARAFEESLKINPTNQGSAKGLNELAAAVR